MNITSLGRTSLKVSDLERSAQFYSQVLGMPVIAERALSPHVALRVGRAHELLLERAEPSVGYAEPIAFVIGNNPRMLEQAAEHLQASGVSYRSVEHEEYESLLLHDPDGRPIELYYWPEW
jgi:catechol 2,3-dioxygenase